MNMKQTLTLLFQNNMKKILTLVMNIANDNYYEDLLYRVQKALDHNLYFLNKLKDKSKIEIIYVDWGSKKPISDYLFVNKKFSNQVKFINVNEKIAKKLSKGYPNFLIMISHIIQVI